MAIPRPGITYNETVATIREATVPDEILCFVVQSSTAIASIDGQLVLYDSFDAFNTVAADKGLPKTLKFISGVLDKIGATQFYVYKVAADTSAEFTKAVTCSTHLKEIRKVIYFEEAASVSGNTFAAKANALIGACKNTSTHGAFRVAYLVPYGTVEAAVEDDEVNPPSTTAVTTTTGLAVNGDGRGYLFMPDNCIAMAGHTADTPVGVDPGFEVVTGVETPKYVFDYNQMDTLRNAGVIFLEPERINGALQYRIHLGVSCAAKASKADQLIVCREVADALLRDVDSELALLIKGKKTENTENMAQESVNNVIDTYVSGEFVTAEGTFLTLTDNGDMTFSINGQITPTRTLVAIEVNTILQ